MVLARSCLEVWFGGILWLSDLTAFWIGGFLNGSLFQCVAFWNGGLQQLVFMNTKLVHRSFYTVVSVWTWMFVTPIMCALRIFAFWRKQISSAIMPNSCKVVIPKWKSVRTSAFHKNAAPSFEKMYVLKLCACSQFDTTQFDKHLNQRFVSEFITSHPNGQESILEHIVWFAAICISGSDIRWLIAMLKWLEAA